jgi:5-hydroxyisourate hydrolase-like protein (transthyretin family)
VLEKKANEIWKELGREKTNADGRIVFDCPKENGDYRLTFQIEEYYGDQDHFFLNTPITFRVKSNERKYHVPLIINPFGISSYRGS